MKRLIPIVLSVLFVAVSTAEEIRSGLQVGDAPSQFNVKDCTGPAAGKTLCYFCRFGRRPVVGVFTRTMNDDVVALAKRIDESLAQNRDKRMAAFLVYVTDDLFTASRQLKAIARQQGIARMPLTVFQDRPEKLLEDYRLSPDAEVTVMMWVNIEVKANHAFGHGGVDSAAVDRIVADTAKILE